MTDNFKNNNEQPMQETPITPAPQEAPTAAPEPVYTPAPVAPTTSTSDSEIDFSKIFSKIDFKRLIKKPLTLVQFLFAIFTFFTIFGGWITSSYDTASAGIFKLKKVLSLNTFLFVLIVLFTIAMIVLLLVNIALFLINVKNSTVINQFIYSVYIVFSIFLIIVISVASKDLNDLGSLFGTGNKLIQIGGAAIWAIIFSAFGILLSIEPLMKKIFTTVGKFLKSHIE